MLSCNIWFSAPSLSMGGGHESRCVGRVCGLDGAVHLCNGNHNLYIYFNTSVAFIKVKVKVK
jgi:hypothetical protein